MKYHDNEVHLTLTGGYSIVSGSYTVNEFSVTSGQDPDGHIYAGIKLSFGSDGSMTFSVGRHGSDSVADWFNNKVPASQTTFNHTAGKLNFAFLGKLVLTLTGGILGKGNKTFTFLNVALAQGHAGASNNWWFGGQNCSNIGDNRVNCKGTDPDGNDVFFTCLRGGNAVNQVTVTPATILDTANWMKRVSDSTRLDQIMMPGSHDAGMSELHHCAPPIVGDSYVKTQGGSVGDQLVYGSRYFDIRVDYDYSTLVSYHRSGQWGCNGQDLKAVLDQAQAFLKAHPTETAILKFSHIRNYNGHDPAVTKQKINDLLNDYSAAMYTNPTGSVNLAEVTLGDVRGKIILVFDYSEYIDTATGRFRYKDGSSVQSGTNITVYDEYSNTSDYNKMKNDQLNKWHDYGGQGKGYLFLLSWTLTPSPPGQGVKDLAKVANSNLPGVLYEQIISNNASKPNIVYIDFVNSTTAQSIIQYNF